MAKETLHPINNLTTNHYYLITKSGQINPPAQYNKKIFTVLTLSASLGVRTDSVLLYCKDILTAITAFVKQKITQNIYHTSNSMDWRLYIPIFFDIPIHYG